LPSTLLSPRLRRITDPTFDATTLPRGDLVTVAAGAPARVGDPPLSAAAWAALDAAQALGREAAAPANCQGSYWVPGW